MVMLKNLIMYHTADFLFHYGITVTCTGYTFGEKGFCVFVLFCGFWTRFIKPNAYQGPIR